MPGLSGTINPPSLDAKDIGADLTAPGLSGDLKTPGLSGDLSTPGLSADLKTPGLSGDIQTAGLPAGALSLTGDLKTPEAPGMVTKRVSELEEAVAAAIPGLVKGEFGSGDLSPKAKAAAAKLHSEITAGISESVPTVKVTAPDVGGLAGVGGVGGGVKGVGDLPSGDLKIDGDLPQVNASIAADGVSSACL